MKTEVVFLVIVFVILVGVGVYYFVQPKEIQFKEPNKDDISLETNTENYSGEDADVLGDIKQNINSSQNTMPQQNQQSQPQAPSMQIDTNKTYTATLKTSEGDIVVELTASKTPVTVNNFVTLAKKNFYNNTIFHRVIKGFMIQGGDPTGTGAGGPGYRFADEPFDGEYTRGTVAMANAGPDTNGSQFFIMHQDSPLPKNYVIFGKVSSGLEVVDKIAEAEVTMSSSGEPSKPVKPVTVKSVQITEE